MKSILNFVFKWRYFMVCEGRLYLLHRRKFWQLTGEYAGACSTDRQFINWLVDYKNGGR